MPAVAAVAHLAYAAHSSLQGNGDAGKLGDNSISGVAAGRWWMEGEFLSPYYAPPAEDVLG